ncbi:hypothetical protein BC941DRAFT_475742 [Chlamydoabsidia padenii]|nr:hypothetical protein BC941DRAFT_475742 [Chlamydoabsidia padenii]
MVLAKVLSAVVVLAVKIDRLPQNWHYVMWPLDGMAGYSLVPRKHQLLKQQLMVLAYFQQTLHNYPCTKYLVWSNIVSVTPASQLAMNSRMIDSDNISISSGLSDTDYAKRKALLTREQQLREEIARLKKEEQELKDKDLWIKQNIVAIRERISGDRR